VNDAPASAALRSEADSVPQDWGRLAQYLAAQGLKLDDSRTPRQFAGGFANLNYLVQIDGLPAVLRRPPMGPLPPGAYDMGRESKILSRLWQQFPLAPRAIHLCTDAAVLGAPFQITEYRAGVSIRDTLPAAQAGNAGIGERLGQMLIEVLAQLHAVDPVRVGLNDLGKPEGFLARATEGWTRRATLATQDWASASTAKLIVDLHRWLLAHAVPDHYIGLLHNDFKLDNVLLDPHTLEPVAVVDWDQGTRGDALFDLATLLAYWTEAGDPPPVLAMRQMPTAHPGFPTRQQAARTYAEITGRDLSDFRFHRVLAQLKTAVIFLQLHLRYRSGETQDARYAEFGSVGEALLELAHEIAHHRMF
jgi:aminoglycoside phosphotransferase (APT) family kinase protein